MIRNVSNKRTLATQKNTCKSLICKGFGLMFTFPRKDYGLIFPFATEKIISLTMIFVFYRIDVLWLDKGKKVVETATLYPFQPNYTPSKKSKYVIELPYKTIKSSRTKIGDKISF